MHPVNPLGGPAPRLHADLSRRLVEHPEIAAAAVFDVVSAPGTSAVRAALLCLDTEAPGRSLADWGAVACNALGGLPGAEARVEALGIAPRDPARLDPATWWDWIARPLGAPRAADEPLAFARASIDEIVALRHRVLRGGLPLRLARFDGDEAEGTLHFAAFERRVARTCLTLLPSTWEGERAWQLRGMATDDGWRGAGLGATLVRRALEDARRTAPNTGLAWCNARAAAIPFYEAQGWCVESDLFEIPLAGPHVRMSCALPRPSVRADDV